MHDRAFFCDICKKQYTNVRQFDEHLQSMDHHHKKRLVELHQVQGWTGIGRDFSGGQDMKGSAEEREKDRLERQKKEQAKADKEMKALLKIQQVSWLVVYRYFVLTFPRRSNWRDRRHVRCPQTLHLRPWMTPACPSGGISPCKLRR